MTAAATVAEAPAGTRPHVLSRRADQDLRTVFFVARPGARGSTEADLLGALGAREDISGRSHSHEDEANRSPVARGP